MIAGVTGHRILSREISVWVSLEIDAFLTRRPIVRGLTSLAVGADQLFANRLQEHGLPFIAVIPDQGYEGTFSELERIEYVRLLGRAVEVIQCPFNSPSEAAFDLAGHLIVDRSEIMVAVWDGAPSRGRGGTADIVAYAQSRGRKTIHIDITTRRVKELP